LASVSHVSRVLVAQQTSPDAHVRAPQISLGVLASAVPPLLLLLLPLRPPLLLLLLLPLRPPLLPLLLLLLLVPLLLLPLLLLLLPEELPPSSPLKPPLPASPDTFVDEPPPHANAATSAAPIDPTNRIRKAFILGLQSGRHVRACASLSQEGAQQCERKDQHGENAYSREYEPLPAPSQDLGIRQRGKRSRMRIHRSSTTLRRSRRRAVRGLA